MENDVLTNTADLKQYCQNCGKDRGKNKRYCTRKCMKQYMRDHNYARGGSDWGHGDHLIHAFAAIDERVMEMDEEDLI
jgi:hypothetical protein